MKSDTLVSVVLIADGAGPSFFDIVPRIQQALDQRYHDYEIVVVAQGPLGGLATNSQIEAILRNVPSVRFIQLAYRVRDEVAKAAGMENAIGDFVILFDPRMDPVSVISEAVEACKTGADAVIGVARGHPPLYRRLLRPLVDYALKSIDYEIPSNATGFYCLSRRAINAVIDTGRFHNQLYLRIRMSGYPLRILPYEIATPDRSEVFPPGRLRILVQMLVFNSVAPLRWVSSIGLTGSVLAFLFGIFSVAVHLVKRQVIEGWTTTILFMSTQFMLQFIILAVFSEYLGRIVGERADQTDYAVVYEKNSLVMVNGDRLNVHRESTAFEENLVQTGRNR